MAHHSDQPFKGDIPEPSEQEQKHFEEIMKQHKKKLDNLKPGETGKFPNGKLNEDDKGEIRINLIFEKDNIIIDFGERPITWIGFTKPQALDLGEKLIVMANKIPDA